MIDEGATAVEFDRAIAVVHLQMKSLRAVFTGDGFREVEEPCANSLPPVAGSTNSSSIQAPLPRYSKLKSKQMTR